MSVLTDAQLEVAELRHLLADVRVGLVAAGWRDDALVLRVKQASEGVLDSKSEIQTLKRQVSELELQLASARREKEQSYEQFPVRMTREAYLEDAAQRDRLAARVRYLEEQLFREKDEGQAAKCGGAS
jgi:long-subunit acyl-CoA synthetase (AMP-forming)